MRTFSVLLTLLCGQALVAADWDFSAPVPLLEFKQHEQRWCWFRDGKQVEADERSMSNLLGAFADHKDDKAGWKGKNKEGFSENLLVVHVAGNAPTDVFGEVLKLSLEAGIKKIALAAAEEITTLPDKAMAPDQTKLDSAYLLIDTYIDPNGLNAMPAVPKEQVTAYCRYESKSDANSYVVAIDARGRVPVENSYERTSSVVLVKDESKVIRKDKNDRRARLQADVVEALEAYINKAGADRIERIELAGMHDGTPWVFAEILGRAALTVNANRERAGLKELEIRWVFLRDIAEPPPPEQPPEKPVEFPKDEPTQEDPTEDDRIVEDAKDDKNEDPDKPNNGLAENPKDDPADDESPRPAGRGDKGGFDHRKARGGKGRANEDRVSAALDWLKDHQNKEGYWSGSDFSADTTRAAAKKTYNIDFVGVGERTGDIGWESTCDVGLTGLALLAFTGAGYDHKEGDYRATCRAAILYLRKVQDNDGCFGLKEDDHFVYNTAICSLAMIEAYGLTGDQVLKPIANKAIEFILKAQNPGLGWRYGVQPGINDSSVTCWMVMALKSAKMAGLEFDSAKTFDDAAKWFELVTVDVNGYPKCGYDSPGSNNARLRSAQDYEHNPTMDAIYILSMLNMGKADIEDKTIRSMATACADKSCLPVWEQYKIDFYYWYHASLALYQVGGSHWASWEKALSKVLLDNQRGWTGSDRDAKLTSKETLDEHGSWDSVDAWGSAGGRVYSTAIGALILETSYRYKRIADSKK